MAIWPPGSIAHRRGRGRKTPRRLVQIYNGGMMPSTADHFYLAFPIEIDGTETEGGTATVSNDASQPIIVDVLGHAPSAGDLLTAYAIGGRWVAERGLPPAAGSLTCLPCSIPLKNLTVSWVNVITGNGSTTLTYTTNPTVWTSGCANGLLYKLLCTAGQIEFRATYFTKGSCPSGTQQYCSNLRTAPLGLTFSSYTCSPFSLTFQAKSTACPTVTNSGYTQFTITM